MTKLLTIALIIIVAILINVLFRTGELTQAEYERRRLLSDWGSREACSLMAKTMQSCGIGIVVGVVIEIGLVAMLVMWWT